MRRKKKSSKKLILWVDDDAYFTGRLAEKLCDYGFEVIQARDASEGYKILCDRHGDINLVILDVMMPFDSSILSKEETRGGFSTGIALGRIIKEKFPDIAIIGFSILKDKDSEEWFNKYGFCYLQKGDINWNELIESINQAIKTEKLQKKRPKMFIVHGHDHSTLFELKDYLQNTLKLGEAMILHQLPSSGRTNIEKFEEKSKNVDIVFVLLTPDDIGYKKSDMNGKKMRARQNVIFEMGYFFGKIQRNKGRILILYKGELELPTDIDGVIYIDNNKGIEGAGEKLRRELSEWL